MCGKMACPHRIQELLHTLSLAVSYTSLLSACSRACFIISFITSKVIEMSPQSCQTNQIQSRSFENFD